MQKTERGLRLPKTYVRGYHNNGQVQKMWYNHLGNAGMQVSVIGFGAAPLGRVYDADLPERQGRAALHRALEGGVNYIDTAPWYGQGKSEAALGQALIGVPREAYYIATKVGRYELDIENMFDFSAERVQRSVDESLKLLGLDYVDLIQVHDLEFAPSTDVIVSETLPALEKVRQAGKARHIGITGYPIDALRRVVERSSVRIDTVLSYCHLSLNDSSLLQHVSFFKERNIGLISASPLSMALLTDRGPPSWHPAQPEIKDAARQAAEFCRRHGYDISNLALKYSISHDEIPLTLIGMDSEEQVARNLEAVHVMQTEEEKRFTECLINRFFSPLKQKGWEEESVQEYRDELAAVGKQNGN